MRKWCPIRLCPRLSTRWSNTRIKWSITFLHPTLAIRYKNRVRLLMLTRAWDKMIRLSWSINPRVQFLLRIAEPKLLNWPIWITQEQGMSKRNCLRWRWLRTPLRLLSILSLLRSNFLCCHLNTADRSINRFTQAKFLCKMLKKERRIRLVKAFRTISRRPRGLRNLLNQVNLRILNWPQWLLTIRSNLLQYLTWLCLTPRSL
jgi:hypothetical protein